GHGFPEVELPVVGVQLHERGSSARSQWDTRLGEDKIEVGPPSLLVIGTLNRLATIEPLLRARLRVRERLCRDEDTVPFHCLANPRPVGVDEDAACVQEHGMNRHGFSLHLSLGWIPVERSCSRSPWAARHSCGPRRATAGLSSPPERRRDRRENRKRRLRAPSSPTPPPRPPSWGAPPTAPHSPP